MMPARTPAQSGLPAGLQASPKALSAFESEALLALGILVPLREITSGGPRDMHVYIKPIETIETFPLPAKTQHFRP